MDALSDDEAALTIIETWGWGRDTRFDEYVPLTIPISDAINRLAMEGHNNPANSIVSLLANSRLVSTGSYIWKKYQNGLYQRDGIGQIPSRRWAALKGGLDEPWESFGPNEVTLQAIDGNWNEREEVRANWEWRYDRFSTAETSGGNTFDSGYFEETYAACDIEVRPADTNDTEIAPYTDALPPAERNKGGAPSKYDWERAVAAIVFQWADDGPWHPTSQAEVKNKLADWFADRDEQPSESLLKDRARWLFAEFQRRNSKADNLVA